MSNPYGFGQRKSDESKHETIRNFRCQKCSKLLAELITSPYQIRCARCKLVNTSEKPGTVVHDR